MARTPKLKVYRTPIGFHDAYVAAPSQKAALEAWGADANLFARGVAEEVTDPALTKAPLDAPGTIVRRMREAEEEEPRPSKKPRAKPAAAPPAEPKPKPKPRPSRAALDEAEDAVAAAGKRHDAALKDIADRLAALDRERRALEKAQAAEQAALEAARDKAAATYEKALDRWRG